MTEFLLRQFVKEPENIEHHKVRTAYGVLAGGVGIAVNLFLFLIKLTVGFLSGSVSVMADAFNNLSDAASSVISFVGVKLAEKPADEEHPFGHGRIEYIAAFIVAFLILQVGFLLLKSSFEKLLHPEVLSVSAVSLGILLLSVALKFWLSAFNGTLGRRINSKVMLAAAADARSDVLATAATIIALLIYRFFGVNIDGLIGLLVSAFVLKAGIGIAKDTLEPIIGERMDPELCKEITEFVKSYEGVLGVHDLIIHNYGPTHSMATIHVELDSRMSLEASHVLLDGIEKDARLKLGLLLVTHADPLDLSDARTETVRAIIEEAVRAEADESISYHDVRLVQGAQGLNAVFDLVLPWECSEERARNLIKRIRSKVREKDPALNCIVTIDRSYGA